MYIPHHHQFSPTHSLLTNLYPIIASIYFLFPTLIILLAVILISDHIGVEIPYLSKRSEIFPHPHHQFPDFLTEFNDFKPFPVEGKLFEPPLRTEGRDIVDATGKRFHLASVNW